MPCRLISALLFFTAVAFEHAFSQSADVLANELGPKFTDVILTGDTAMFKGQFLCALSQIATEAAFPLVRAVPLCTKHGSNEVDGDAGRVKPIAKKMVNLNTYPENNHAAFCAVIMQRCSDSKTRAFPLCHLVDLSKSHIDAMMPGGDPGNVRSPQRGFGEIMITGNAKHSLLCRTHVHVPEPWHLGSKLGYPLPPNVAAPGWLFVNLVDKPTSQCIPCATLQMKRVPKEGHVVCAFANFTKHKRCGICAQRTGHTARNCPRNSKEVPLPLSELKHVCRALSLPTKGKKAELLARIQAHQDDSFVPEETEDVGNYILLDESDIESEASDLSDEAEIEFNLPGEENLH